MLLAMGSDGRCCGRPHAHGAQQLRHVLVASADFAAAQSQPALVWPQEMPEPMTNYVGRRVQAFGLRVTAVDADEGFWVSKDGRTAWVQLETPPRAPTPCCPVRR